VTSLLDPIIQVRTSAGVSRASLPEIFGYCRDGSLLDLPGMRADQRAPLVTTLAILVHLEDRYGVKVEDALGVAGMNLVGDFAVPAFLQPALTHGNAPLPMTDLDHTSTGAAHHYKPVDTLPVEHAFFALVASPFRNRIGVGNVAGVRQRCVTVLVGDGVTLASEAVHLAAGYTASPLAKPNPGATLKDHLLWTRPWGRYLHSSLPWPYLDCRLVRLKMAGADIAAVRSKAEPKPLVDAGTGDIGDPHVPIEDDGRPMGLRRRITYQQAHAALCGSDQIRRPVMIDNVPDGHSVRIGAVAVKRFNSNGYWEMTASIEREKWMLFGAGGSDRLADLSKRTLAQCSRAEQSVSGASRRLFSTATRENPVAQAHTYRAADMLTDRLGPASLQLVCSLMAQLPDEDAEAIAIASMCAKHVRATWDSFARTQADLLAVARASLRLDYLMQRYFQEKLFMTQTSPLAQRVHRVIADMDDHLTPDNRASIRGSGGTLPLAAYVALARAPIEWTQDDATALPAMAETVRALGRVRHRGFSVGRVLAEIEYPEARLSALLAARGDHVIDLVAEIVRWIIAHDVDEVALTDLVTFAVADATGDIVARDAARHRIALDYARRMEKKQKRKNSQGS
jgi:hypothetical protein